MKKSFGLLAAICTLALALTIGFTSVASASVAKTETVDKTVTDFTAGSSDGFTLGGSATLSQSGVQLVGDGVLSTNAGYKSFLAQFVLGDMVKGFTVSFGDSANRVSLRFDGSAARVYATGLVSGTSDVVTLSDYLTSGATVQIEVIGGEIEVAVKNADQPYDALGTPAATFVYADGKAVSRGSVTVSVFDGAICAVKETNIYSLDPTVTIPTEDYVAPAPDEPKDDKKFNALYVVIPVASVAVIGAAAAIVIVTLKRRKR